MISPAPIRRPVTLETTATLGSRCSIWAASAVRAARAGSTIGEWKACVIVSGRTRTPSRSKPMQASRIASTVPDSTT